MAAEWITRCGQFEVTAALEQIQFWLEWLRQRAGIAVDAVVKRADEVGATIENLYFDSPGVR